MTEPTCLVCGHRGLSPHFEILLRCGACGFVTARMDEPVDTQDLYADDFFKGKEYFNYVSDEAVLKRHFLSRLKGILRRRCGRRLLEIGAAYGFFLDLAKRHFDVVGYEMNHEAARYARETFGVDVRTDDFLHSTAAAIGGPVDVTVMWDVIEHLMRPDEFIAHIARLSRPGAFLYITTGDIDSLLARWRGRKWRLIHPPTHVHYFSRSTLARLLANHGFRVVDVHSVGAARSLRQILYSVLVLRMGRVKTYQAMEKLVPATWGLTINTLDIMQVVAERAA